MRKHGWQLPYHPLQVVAVAVFLALGFAFYVFFVPFVGRKIFQYIVMALYTPLITGVFCLYIWCAAADPGDPGVFKSKKYLNVVDRKKSRVSKLGEDSVSSLNDGNTETFGEKSVKEGAASMESIGEDPDDKYKEGNSSSGHQCCMFLLGILTCGLIYICWKPHEESPVQQMSEDGMFYCSLCEVEEIQIKFIKHYFAIDCIGLNNGKCEKPSYCSFRLLSFPLSHTTRFLSTASIAEFVTSALTISIITAGGSTIALEKRIIGSSSPSWLLPYSWSVHGLCTLGLRLQLILQWSTGILVMICCFLDRKHFSVEITSKLGSSFSFAPFVVVVGISTYDYIIALREQEQQLVGGQQSPQMSPASSLTGLSSASSFNTFHRAAWCTPPRLFLEDQFDVVPPEAGMSVSSSGKRVLGEEASRKKKPGTLKINPWALARLNAEEVSKAAMEARKKSRVLQPVVRQVAPTGLETDSSLGSSGRMAPRPENRRRSSKRVRLPVNLPIEPLAEMSAEAADNNSLASDTSASLAPLQLEARSAFRTSRAMSVTSGIVVSSPESSLESPDHPFRVSSSGAEEARGLATLSAAGSQKGIPLSRSTSDGYEASGGEDSDRVPSRIMLRPTNWSNLLFNSDKAVNYKAPSSSSQVNSRKP
ncbi:hypothetical protein Syun_023452 [Stephania yunnanensis]|uniref:S-acyltransferase n=1 Tax=Stephania yunnanensis TaxID=152371 RepID=A0AAP0F9U9_9MAGN